MRTYITEKELASLRQADQDSLQRQLFEKMCRRVEGFTGTDTLKQEEDLQQEWYHLIWGRISEAAFVYRVRKEKKLGQWIHNRIMELVLLEEDDWIGPWFRPRREKVPVGTLETAKITLALCEACLNAADVFTEEELAAVHKVLAEKGLVLLGRHTHRLLSKEPCSKNNWFMVTNCAYGAAAAVLGQEQEVQRAMEVLKITLDFFDRDSYGEPLNYAEMASTYISLLCEILYRLGYMKEVQMPLETLADMLPWYAASIQEVQYAEEEKGCIPMAFNFGDSNLHMYFQSDKFVQMAVRLKDKSPVKAGLASWLFGLPDTDFYGLSYLGLLLMPDMASPISPYQADLPTVKRFRVGQILMRDTWKNPRIQAAIAAGGEEMQISSHKHPDQNSFQVTVGRERMLIDPGMCCYRLWSQQQAKEERNHSGIALFRDGQLLPQHPVSGRLVPEGERYVNQLLVYEAFQDVQIVVSDAAGLYGEAGPHSEAGQHGAAKPHGEAGSGMHVEQAPGREQCADKVDRGPVKKAIRIWVICMPHMMFVADYVVSEEPLGLETNFVMNNEDNRLKTNVYNAHRLVFRRGSEAMKLFNGLNLVDGREVETMLSFDWTCVHHRYGIQPNSPGQGKEGSGLIYRWSSPGEGLVHQRVHTLMMDEEKNIKYWHMRQADDFIRLEAPDHEDTLDFRFTKEGFAVRRKGQIRCWSLQ